MEFLWTDFVNSEWHDWRGSGRSEDRLEDAAWLKEMLSNRSLSAPVPPGPEDMAALKAFRSRLRDMAARLAAGGSLTSAEAEELNGFLAGGPVIRRLDGTAPDYKLALLPMRQDWQQVMAEVAASFLRTVTEGETSRVRVCENPDCLWVFYDDTRSRTKRFCDDKLCGNLIKVRRFRERRKAEEGNSPAT